MAERRPIDYARLVQALLQQAPTLVAMWLPNGIERNGRWYVGDFDGSPGESANVNLATGQWIDNAAPDEDKGGDLTSLYRRVRHLPTMHDAAVELMQQLGWWEELQRGGDAPAAARPAPSPQAEAAPEAPPAAPHEAARPAKRAQRWKAVVPVPSFAPKPGFTFGYRDRAQGDAWVELDAVRTWEYRFEGQLYGYVARFERVNSKGETVKDTVARTWCENLEDGRGLQRWHWKSWDAPRPLYVPATLLSADLSLPVVLVEGEKCAEAGHQALGHEFDFVSWPGGAKAWALARWGWLMGRTVYLWPDCDAKRKRLSAEAQASGQTPQDMPLLDEAMQPGMRAMVGIGSELQAKHGCTVNLVRVPKPGDKPDGWDIADAIAEGWTPAQLRDFIRGAVPFVAPDEAVRSAAAALPTRSSAAAMEGEEAEGLDGAVPWKRFLLLSSSGAVKAVRENVVLALDGRPDKGVAGVPECRGLIAFNEFTNNVELTREAPWGSAAGPWGEADELLMGEWLVREHGLPSMARQTLEEAVLMVARRNAYHPLRQRVEALRGKWDRRPRLATWLRLCCLEEDEWDDSDPLQQYLALAGTWFLMGMVCRVLTPEKKGAVTVRGPGTKFDNMLIFEGAQYAGKSSLAATLGGEYFADTGLTLGEKDSYQNIQGVLVYEWAELDNMSKQEVSRVKQFVSSPKDRFRATFDRRPRDYPRQVVFVGTTNESHYLSDITGNRRFWPVRVTRDSVDYVWLRENLEQMMAEALQRLDDGERFWPTPQQQRELFAPQQRERTVESGIESAIRRYLYDPDQKVPHMGENGTLVNQVTLLDLLDRIGYSVDKQTDAVVKKVGAVMHMLGWAVRRTSLPGRPRAYVRPNPDPNTQREAAAAAAGARGSDGSTAPTQGKTEGDDDCPF